MSSLPENLPQLIVGRVSHILPKPNGAKINWRLFLEFKNRGSSRITEGKAEFFITAHFVNTMKQMKKGDLVEIAYLITGREYEDRTGEKRIGANFDIEKIRIVEGGNADQSATDKLNFGVTKSADDEYRDDPFKSRGGIPF